MGNLFLDLETFFRIMRLTLFWEDKKSQSQPEDTEDDSLDSDNSRDETSQSSDEEIAPFHENKFVNKSRFDSLRYNQGAFDVVQKTVRHDISKQPIKVSKYQNLNKAECHALLELANSPHIVIKKSDKGSAVVVQSTEQYLNECFKQLSDRKYYIPKNRDLTSEHNIKVYELVDNINSIGSISDKCADYLKILNPRVLAFYTLPKIHKKVNSPPSRPILSANNAPTERTSEFVDHFLQPYLVEMKSHV